MSAAQLLAGSLAVPAVGALAIALAGRWPNLRETVTLATAVALLACVAGLVPTVLAGGIPQLYLVEMLPGIPLGLRVEPLGMLFALVASTLWILNSVYSIGYMRGNDEPHQTRFYVCFALSLFATMGIAFSSNLLTLFLFYEVLTLATWPLVTHHGGEEARRGGRLYLWLLLGTSIMLLLPGIIVTWQLAGTLEFTPGGILKDKVHGAAAGGLLALFMFGIGKAALMPFHRWLPAAMVAPTPVSALLHAVAVVKAGVFSIVKVIVYVFGVDSLAAAGGADWLSLVAGFTIIAASIVALRADNLKRRLAYSTVSQLSYVVLAAALLAPFSVIAAALHIAVHAVGKITLFFAAGAIYTAAHKTEVSQLDGIGRRMPVTMIAFTIGALSMIGLPPAAGFVSKWYLLAGAMGTANWFAVAVVCASTLLNAGYFLPIVHRAFFRAPPAGSHAHGEAPLPMLVALSFTAAGTIALFFLPGLPLALARQLVSAP
ncbi:MAG: monovalent cation/H+ antiporter subunit D family protein [Burkholderiales bacterium]